ncbi:DddA-like double-stranded DNA deaminase toxin [Actinokineospora sp. G85]|uniref:DddA-like double-stranded DNA deaminase toxin n=1 Tax=Actinokineospora sp. G85 TaxID=3406626 RepID=UPI003C732421
MLLDESIRGLRRVLGQSNDPQAQAALSSLELAHSDVARTRLVLDDVERLVNGYLANLGAGGEVQQAKRPTELPPATSLVEKLRAQLPPPVPPVDQRPSGGPRLRTHGRWVDPDGEVRPIVSGQDEMYTEAVAAFPALGLRRGIPSRASDVEMKLAAHMRNHDIRTATVVINYLPCRGPFSCDELVPVLLPEGSTLTVYGTDGFVKTYKGGATPPWQKR